MTVIFLKCIEELSCKAVSALMEDTNIANISTTFINKRNTKGFYNLGYFATNKIPVPSVSATVIFKKEQASFCLYFQNSSPK